jgi:hypothetical protein
VVQEDSISMAFVQETEKEIYKMEGSKSVDRDRGDKDKLVPYFKGLTKTRTGFWARTHTRAIHVLHTLTTLIPQYLPDLSS